VLEQPRGHRVKRADLAGNVDGILIISETVVGWHSVSGGTYFGRITGAAAAEVDAQMLATSVKD